MSYKDSVNYFLLRIKNLDPFIFDGGVPHGFRLCFFCSRSAEVEHEPNCLWVLLKEFFEEETIEQNRSIWGESLQTNQLTINWGEGFFAYRGFILFVLNGYTLPMDMEVIKKQINSHLDEGEPLALKGLGILAIPSSYRDGFKFIQE